MRPQQQKFKHDPANGSYGDCFRTALACILDLDRDEVPHFNEGLQFDDGNQMGIIYMTPSTVRIVKIGPLQAYLAYRIIEKSWIANYRKFIPIWAILSFAGRRHWLTIRNDILNPRSRTFLAFKGRVAVATMIIIRRDWGLEVDELFVLPGSTSIGIGSALLKIAKSEAAKSGFRLRIGAMAFNRRARRFYEREGGKLIMKYRYGWGDVSFPSVIYEWAR